MKLSAPTQSVFLIAVVFAVLALLGFTGVVAQIAAYSFWLMTAAFAVLAIGCFLKGV